MNLTVAVQAAIPSGKGTVVITIGSTGVAVVGVTALTQHRRLTSQHGVIHRPMNVVAVTTVIYHRLMLPQHRTALIRMTLVAGVINTDFGQAGIAQ